MGEVVGGIRSLKGTSPVESNDQDSSCCLDLAQDQLIGRRVATVQIIAMRMFFAQPPEMMAIILLAKVVRN